MGKPERRIAPAPRGGSHPEARMQLDIRGRSVHVSPEFSSHRGATALCAAALRAARGDLGSLWLPSRSDRRKLAIKSWVQLHHLELMKSCGRSIARSIAKSQGNGDLARHRTVAARRLRGARVRVLEDGWRAAGRAEATWDGKRGDGTQAGPGVYFCVMTSGRRFIGRSRLALLQ